MLRVKKPPEPIEVLTGKVEELTPQLEAVRAEVERVKKTLLDAEARGEDRAPVFLNWQLVTTAVTANQVIGEEKFAGGYHFYIQTIIVEVYYATLSTTAALLGDLELRWEQRRLHGPWMASNTSSGALFGMVIPIPEGERLTATGGAVLAAFCTPATQTETVWRVNIIGYLKKK